jgi:hypothetical protein
MSDHPRNGPPKKVEGQAPHHRDRPTTRRFSSHDTADTEQFSCHTGKCAFGVVCTCDFYADWTVDWPAPDPVPVQLQRRRQASYRCPRLASGRRDPLSESVW